MKTASTSNLHLAALQRRIKAVREKRFRVKALTGLFLSITVLLGGLTTESILDRLVNLPWFARAVILLGCLGGTSYLLWRESIKPLRKRLNDDDVSLIIEHALPRFSTRFIASIQLSRDPKTRNSSLVRALMVQTAVMAKALDFKNVIKTEKLKRILKRFLGIVVIASLLIFLGGQVSVLLLKRALLFNVPLPGWTYFLNVTEGKNIGIGEDFKIEVTAGGIIPAQGRVIATNELGQKREFVLTPNGEKSPQFTAVIHGAQESFSYLVKLGDATSLTYKVKVFKRPTAVNVACEQIYPAYVGAAPVPRQVSDLALLVGSRLKVNVKASMNITKAGIRLEGLDQEVPMQIDPKDPSILHGELEVPAKDLTGFSVKMTSSDGVDSKESVIYRIDLVPDHDPAVKIIVPSRREEVATSQATLGIAFEATDDFGISKASLHYSVDQTPEKTIEFDLGNRITKTISRHFDWKISSLQPAVKTGSIIEFWITVADSNNVTGPGVGSTEHYQTKIVGDDEKRLDLANRLRETMSGVNDITESQQDLTKNLGEPLFEKKSR